MYKRSMIPACLGNPAKAISKTITDVKNKCKYHSLHKYEVMHAHTTASSNVRASSLSIFFAVVAESILYHTRFLEMSTKQTLSE